ncbi:MAG: lipocalin family protein, partial [Chlorobi bacterium]|nr:lipocalin family protein [Chlorobiota bacterium]
MDKLLKKIVTLSIIVILTLLMTNCKSDSGNPTSPASDKDQNLIGKWQLVEAFIPSMNITVTAEQLGISVVAEFKADGNYSMTTTDTTATPKIETGTWTTANGTLTLKSSADGTEEKIPYTITGDTGILKSTYEIQPGVEIPAEYKFK